MLSSRRGRPMAERGAALDNRLKTGIDATGPRARANRAALATLLAAVRAEEVKIREGGGTRAAESQRAKGRMTVRERLDLLLDEGASSLLELGLWAAHGMYAEYGGAPAAGVVTGL